MIMIKSPVGTGIEKMASRLMKRWDLARQVQEKMGPEN